MKSGKVHVQVQVENILLKLDAIMAYTMFHLHPTSSKSKILVTY